MELPSHGEIGEALKHLLKARGNAPLSASQAYEMLAQHFKLDRVQTTLMLDTASGRENAWQNRCRTARGHLVKTGVLNQKPFDTWALTPRAFRGLSMTAEELGL
jgi:restriction endonuclease Mrr